MKSTVVTSANFDFLEQHAAELVRLGARPSNVTEPANLKFYCSLEDKQDTI
jgi:hypothetical protein